MKLHTVCLTALMGLALIAATPAAADEFNQRTIFTFSGTVELPGKTLPAGTYTFKLPDTMSGRNVVQIFNEKGNEILTTLLTVPAQRMEATDKPVVMFSERVQDMPPAVQYWFYPGRRIGHEFIYPREQAMRIARASNKSVLSAESTDTSAKVTTITPEGRESEFTERTVEETQTARAEPEPSRPEPAVGVQTGQSASAQDTRPAPPSMPATSGDRLPQTASPEPLMFLLAAASLLGLTTLGGLRRF